MAFDCCGGTPPTSPSSTSCSCSSRVPRPGTQSSWSRTSRRGRSSCAGPPSRSSATSTRASACGWTTV